MCKKNKNGFSSLVAIITVASLILIIILGGVAFFYFKTSKKLTVETDKTEQKSTENKAVNFNSEGAIKDCGSSDLLLSDSLNIPEEVIEKDTAFVCLGNSILNDCQHAKAQIKSSNAGAVIYEIKKDDNKECILHTEYGNADQIPLKEQKQYANTFSDCKISAIINFLTTISPDSKKNSNEAKLKPGSYAFSLYIANGIVYMGLMSSKPDETLINVCTGTLINLIKNAYK